MYNIDLLRQKKDGSGGFTMTNNINLSNSKLRLDGSDDRGLQENRRMFGGLLRVLDANTSTSMQRKNILPEGILNEDESRFAKVNYLDLGESKTITVPTSLRKIGEEMYKITIQRVRASQKPELRNVGTIEMGDWLSYCRFVR